MLALGALVALVVATSACTTSSATPTAVAPNVTLATEALVSIGAGVSGPAGLTASIYATGVANASGLVVDPQGRLWIATAAAQDSGADAIYLVATPGAAPVKVVDDIATPMGLLWHDDALYVSSIGRVDALSGFDGTAFTDVRTIVELPDGVGMSNGLAIGPDGRIRLGISAPCDGCSPTSPLSASIISFAPDGTDLRVDVSSVRAPIGLAYYPGTDDLFVTMNQRDGLGDQTPGDWLAVVEAGQDWGFPECAGSTYVGADAPTGTTDDTDPGASAGTTAATTAPDPAAVTTATADCSTVPTPLAELDPHAAVSGLAIVTGQLGPAVGTTAIVAEWATGKVQQVALTSTADGAYRGAVEPFVSGIEKPVPVLLAPDGAVLIGDWATGSIYRIARSS